MILGIGCSGKKSPIQGSASNSSQETFVWFESPNSSTMPTQATDVILKVSQQDQMMSLRLLVDGEEVKNFTRTPFEWEFDPSQHLANEVTLKAEAMKRDGTWHYATLILSRGGSTPGPGSLSSRGAGTFDPQCLTNNTHDACIFWKNPVAQRGSPYPTKVRFGQNLTDSQTFGVRLTGMSNPNSLRNSSIRVVASDGVTAQPTNGRWVFDYRNDASNHGTAQVMAYFWLSYQEREMMRRGGSFFARNQNILVDAYDSSVGENAYWDGGSFRIVMGAATTTGTSTGPRAHEMALSAEVYLHEMGHANLQYAVGGYSGIAPNGSNETCDSQTCYCRTQNGCIGAINEGQADFHFLMLFGNETTPSTAMGETWKNTMQGLASRNVANNMSVSAAQQFNLTDGQIHQMGALYAAILWQIYRSPTVDKVEFEKIFLGHLQMLTGTSRFIEAREALIAQDTAHFNGKYRTIIQTAFSSRGL